jgi:Fe-S-cluster-containing dehydrogenase component
MAAKPARWPANLKNATPVGVLWRGSENFTLTTRTRWRLSRCRATTATIPQCMKVCPADTYSKRPNGIVVQDHDKCIGCRMCIMACPYNAPVFDPVEGKTSKCNLCAERLDEGLLPRCVASCPAGVLQFGDIDELRARHSADLARIETRYSLPDHRISQPNIVIIPAGDKE